MTEHGERTRGSVWSKSRSSLLVGLQFRPPRRSAVAHARTRLAHRTQPVSHYPSLPPPLRRLHRTAPPTRPPPPLPRLACPPNPPLRPTPPARRYSPPAAGPASSFAAGGLLLPAAASDPAATRCFRPRSYWPPSPLRPLSVSIPKSISPRASPISDPVPLLLDWRGADKIRPRPDAVPVAGTGCAKNSSFSCSRDRVKIITGMEEAYYGWVTFETDKAVQGDTGVGLTIGSVNHQLSAYSLSGYGLNDAFDKSVAHLVKMLGGTAGNGKVQVKHPCLQTGYREDYVCSYCHPLKQDGSPSVSGKTTGKEKQGTAVELIGAPQWKECSDLAKVTVNLSEWSNSSSGLDCNLQPCALANSFPQPHGQFYAMSGFYVVFKFFNLTPDATLVDVLKRGQEFCEKPWDVARSSVPPQPFIEQYCFSNSIPRSFRKSYLPLFRPNNGGSSALGMGSPFRFHLWRHINSGDGRTKTPLSPTVAGSEPHPFSMTHGLGGSSVQLMESSRQSLGVYHSYSVGSLGQMQFSSGRGQTTLQSRRSQSREDLTSSLADLHVQKV
ncbi:hypothetical protein ZWY2020_043992 [Hordeum vulgare]|nr:hypothetical protein ZWY2020_043992 [Hordeum vulgare]